MAESDQPAAQAPPAAVLFVRGRITPATVPLWCERVAALLADPAVGAITCDLSGVVQPDLTAIDALARMQLAARRLGRTIRLRHPSTKMCALLALTGLTDVVPAHPHRP